MVASPVPLLARTVRGIEWVSAAELTTGYGASAVELGHRFVEFRAPLQPSLLEAGSVDDIFSLASRFEGLDHRRSALSDLAEQAAGVHVAPLLDRLASVRPPPPDRRFEVVASFLGRRNYTRFEIERAVGTGLEAASAGRFVPGPIREGEHPSLSWRVHLFDGGGSSGLGSPRHHCTGAPIAPGQSRGACTRRWPGQPCCSQAWNRAIWSSTPAAAPVPCRWRPRSSSRRPG
jgi:hypothetical protein